MTRDDIIRMAREAGWKPLGENPKTEFTFFLDNLERFAILVAAKERETCAQVCESIAEEHAFDPRSPVFTGLRFWILDWYPERWRRSFQPRPPSHCPSRSRDWEEHEMTFKQLASSHCGYWILPGSTSAQSVRFYTPVKPNWLHRTMMRVLLGWEWRDDK
jgi:hypothetical protein